MSTITITSTVTKEVEFAFPKCISVNDIWWVYFKDEKNVFKVQVFFQDSISVSDFEREKSLLFHDHIEITLDEFRDKYAEVLNKINNLL